MERLAVEIDDYFCMTCLGLKKLPTRLVLPLRFRRWCICEYDKLQAYFEEAAEHFAEDDEEKPAVLWFSEEEDKAIQAFADVLSRTISLSKQQITKAIYDALCANLVKKEQEPDVPTDH